MLIKNRRSTKRKSLRNREKKSVEKKRNRPRGVIETSLSRKKRCSNLVVKRLNELLHLRHLETRVTKAGQLKLLLGVGKLFRSPRLFNQGKKRRRSLHVGSSIGTRAEKSSRIKGASPALTIQRAIQDPGTTRPT